MYGLGHYFLRIAGLALVWIPAAAPASTKRTIPTTHAYPSTVPLRTLHLKGSSIASDLVQVARPYVGLAVNADRLKKLASDLDAVYARSDIAIYMIDLRGVSEDGQLNVDVREGYVQQLSFEGLGRGIGARVQALAQSLQRGTGALSKARLQRVLRLVQAIPGGKVEATMVAGTAPGGLNIHFHSAGRDRQFGFLLHNNGQRLTGRAQAVASVLGNSVIRAGDQIGFQFGRNLNNRVKLGSVAYSMPLGSRGLAMDMSAAGSASHIADLDLRGDAYGLAAALSYPLVLNERDSLFATLSANLQVSETRFVGYLLYREKTPAIRAALRWRRETSRAISGVMLTASRSMPGSPVKISAPLADRHFTKMEAQISHDRLVGRSMALRLRMMGQYSPDALTQAEGVALGGQSYGRAYDSGILIGDSAIGGNAELVWAPSTLKARRIELFGALDVARAYYNERPLYNSGQFDLASLGGGARVNDGGVSADLSVYRALISPFPGYDKGWRALVSVGFSLP